MVALPFLLQVSLLLGSVQPLTLERASELAQAKSPDLAELRAEVPIAEAGVEIAGQLPNPTVGVSVGPDDPKITGSVDQKLPIFGQRGTSVRAAQAQVGVARASLVLKRIEVAAAVRRAYFGLVQAQLEGKLTDERLTRAQKLADLIREKFKLGAASQLEVEQAVLALERAQQAAQDRAVETRAFRQGLALTLGGDSSDELEATTPMLPLPVLPERAQLLARVGTHPEVRVAREREAAARAREDREGAAIRPLPDVSLTFLQCSVAGTCAQQRAVGIRAGIAFDLPVLSQNRGGVHQAQKEALQAEAAADAALRRRTSAASVAYSRWEAAVRRSEFLERTVVPQALHVEALARLAYQFGRAPLVNVLQAQSDVADVQSQAVAAAAAAQSAFADVEEAVGATL